MALVPVNNRDHIVENNFRGRVIDEYGVSKFRSGQSLEMGFLDSIFACYSLLVFHPFALISLVTGLFIFFAEYHNSHGPLEILAGTVVDLLNSNDTAGILKAVLSLLLVVLNILINYKLFVGKVCLILFTYICKPSGRHMTIAIILILLSLFKTFTYIEIFLMSQFFFLFACLRKPFYKTIFIVLFVLIFLSGFFHLDTVLDSTLTTYQKLNKPVAPQKSSSSSSSGGRTTTIRTPTST